MKLKREQKFCYFDVRKKTRTSPSTTNGLSTKTNGLFDKAYHSSSFHQIGFSSESSLITRRQIEKKSKERERWLKTTEKWRMNRRRRSHAGSGFGLYHPYFSDWSWSHSREISTSLPVLRSPLLSPASAAVSPLSLSLHLSLSTLQISNSPYISPCFVLILFIFQLLKVTGWSRHQCHHMQVDPLFSFWF